MSAFESMLIINFLIAGTAFSALLMAAAELFSENRKPIHYVSSALYLVCGCAILVDVINHTSLFGEYPYFAYVNDSLEMLMAPLFYYYFRTLFLPHEKKFSPGLLLFVPAAVTIALYMPLYLQSAQFKLEHYPIYRLGDVPFSGFYYVINHFEVIWIIFCLLLGVYRANLLFGRKKAVERNQRIQARKKMVLRICVSWIFVLGFFVYVSFFPNPLLQRLIILIACVIVCALLIVRYRYKDLVTSVKNELSEKTYNRSCIGGLNIDAVISRLNDLMEYEKLYMDSELTLGELSRRLGITTHQLSEIMNRGLSGNFKQYINSLRVEAAKKMLSEGDRTVLAIAFDCGFNSKASFNSVFSKVTGMTPSEYRMKFRVA
jgi:AraC-like DNA-binding protein